MKGTLFFLTGFALCCFDHIVAGAFLILLSFLINE